MMLFRSRMVRALFVPVAVLAAGACLREPVNERVCVRFLPDGRVAVAHRVDIAPPELRNRLMEDRLRRFGVDLIEGRDPWSRRFEILNPRIERRTWQRESGEVRWVEQVALAGGRDRVRKFFRDAGLDFVYAEGEGWARVEIFPGESLRATVQQRRRVEGFLDAWSEAYAEYLRAMADLYRYLETNPGRARACMGALVRDLLSEEERDALPEPDAYEETLLDEVNPPADTLLDLFSAPEDSAYTREELLRLVHDPFPAAISVQVPGVADEVEGFEDRGGGRYAIPPLGPWEAVERLEGRWLSPDPFVLQVGMDRSGKGEDDFDFEAFLARPRRAAPPAGGSEVQTALLDEMTPSPAYRLRWHPPKGSDVSFVTLFQEPFF